MNQFVQQHGLHYVQFFVFFFHFFIQICWRFLKDKAIKFFQVCNKKISNIVSMIPQGTETRNSLIKLVNNPVKQYAWGYSNSDCYVGRFSYQQKKLSNYAELWMGIHPHGQSEIMINNSSGNQQKQKLSTFINSIHKTLPYLFKVLSIQKCLSIQTHPTKAQALNLHSSNPGCYSDPNDKPQMFYTLTKFECFLGYICAEEFERIININIFKQTINKNNDVKTPRQAIIQILSLDQVEQAQLVNACLGSLELVHPDRYGQGKGKGNIWKILEDFQNDIGIVVSFFLDYRVLLPGSCFYIQCNVPHAYISGQCIEIMKNSDNVCRLGLTPKYKDLSIINQILTNNFDPILPVSPAMQFQGLQFTQTLYKANSLNLQILCSKQKKQTQNICQPQMIFGELDIIRILLILKGQFAIQQENKDNQQQNGFQNCQEGTCVLLVPGKRYKVRKIAKKGEKIEDGVFCVGWGDF